MRHTARLLAGIVIGASILWVSTMLLALLAVWSPFPIGWWRRYPHVVIVGSEAIVTLPAIIALAIIFTKLFSTRAPLKAFISMALGVVVTFADTVRHPELIIPTAQSIWPYFLPYVIGPSLFIYVLFAMRSNYRIERPRER